jgi:hypothetical protein
VQPLQGARAQRGDVRRSDVISQRPIAIAPCFHPAAVMDTSLFPSLMLEQCQLVKILLNQAGNAREARALQ